jgi:endoglucanase
MHRKAIVVALAALIGLAAQPLAAAPGDATEKLLGELADAAGPPGFEEPVRVVMVRHLKPLADSIRYDGVGSIIAQHGNAGPKIMLDAHMDELGGVVRRVTPQGYLTMQMPRI